MPGKSLWVVVLLTNVLIAGAAAQNNKIELNDEKNEVGGAIGRIFISDQGIKSAIPNPTIHSGKGLTFEGEYARRVIIRVLSPTTAESSSMQGNISILWCRKDIRSFSLRLRQG